MKKRNLFLLSFVALVFFSGCAGHAPTAEFKKPLADVNRLCPTDEVTVKLSTSDGVVLNDITRQRLESRLLQTITEKKKTAQCNTTDKRAFVLSSKITEYDEGNAFARLMLAGLGQMHITGDFILNLLPAENESVAEFTISKTFAWGGLYGGTTRIEDIEQAFCLGVAEAIVGNNAK